MKQIKNIVAALLVLCMALSLCACGSGDTAVVATEAPTEAVEVTEAPVEETEAEAVDPGLTTYSITVVDEESTPIAGAMVQICMETCYPGVTNESGVAQFSVQEADYKVSFLSLPAGYTYSTEEDTFYFESGSTEMTITLKAAE